MDEEKRIKKESQDFIRKNKSVIFKKFADEAVFVRDLAPVSIFMAGSPGAGKTEISKELVAQFTSPAVRIDADEIRMLCEGYSGVNAHLFQLAASIGVDELYNFCLEKGFNLVVDGTFAHNKTISNIEKSLAKNRKVIIYFIHQDPQIAWDFTKKREVVEHRKITKDIFIRGFLMSQFNVNDAKTKFGENIELNLIIKNITNDAVSDIYENILSVDSHLNITYTNDELNNLLQ